MPFEKSHSIRICDAITVPGQAPPIAVTIPKAVELSGHSRSAVYEAMKRGDLPARKAGRRTLILMADLEAYLACLPIYPAGE